MGEHDALREPVRRNPSCDFHGKRQATNILRVRGAAFFLCRSCYLSRRDIIASTMTPPHLMNERRRGMSSESDDQG